MLGRDFVASIYRLGLSTFRIAMVLSIARLRKRFPKVPQPSISENATTLHYLPRRRLGQCHNHRRHTDAARRKIFATLMPNKEEDGTLGIKLSPKSVKDSSRTFPTSSIAKRFFLSEKAWHSSAHSREICRANMSTSTVYANEQETANMRRLQQNADERSLSYRCLESAEKVVSLQSVRETRATGP